MSKSTGLLCIVAGQRSGTTALQSALSSSGFFHDFGEIFQTNEARRVGSFLNFVEANGIRISDMVSHEGASRVCSDYLSHLADISPESRPLIDVKFNSWGALRPFWGYPADEPMFMKGLKERDCKFIFVARKNLTAQIASEHIARYANKWHGLQEGDVASSMEINKGAAMKQARLTIESEKMLFSFLKESGRVYPVWYEDLYVEGAVNPRLCDWIEKELGLRFAGPVQPKIAKNRVKKESAVSNLDEIRGGIEKLIGELGRVDF